MQAIPYDPSLHLDQVKAWAEAWKFNVPFWCLSPIGFIVPGVWVSFLMLTNTPVAMIEPTWTNPECSRAERDEAHLLVHDALIAEAKRHGKKMMMGPVPTTHASYQRRATDLGWYVHPVAYNYLFKDISGE